MYSVSAMTKLIVEICQNHNGSRETVREMIQAATLAGADIIKMQSMWSADLPKRERFEEGEVHAQTGIRTAIKRPHGPEQERLATLDLSIDDHQFFIDTCHRYGVLPMTTIFSRHRIAEVAGPKAPGKWVKVASYDCASYPMLRELAEHFDNFIISTGATYDHEIQKTAELMKSLGKNFSFLHCVTSYPNALEICNLARMEWLRQFTPTVGWSDHTKIADTGLAAAKIAIMLGADYVERHFTILPADQTKDGPVSINPAMLRELSAFRNLSKAQQQEQIAKEYPNWKSAVGVPVREMGHIELLNRDYYRGRFASPDGNGGWIYNWEEKPVRFA